MNPVLGKGVRDIYDSFPIGYIMWSHLALFMCHVPHESSQDLPFNGMSEPISHLITPKYIDGSSGHASFCMPTWRVVFIVPQLMGPFNNFIMINDMVLTPNPNSKYHHMSSC